MEGLVKRSATRLKEEMHKECLKNLETEHLEDVNQDERNKIKLKILTNDIFVQLFNGIDGADDDFLIKDFHNIVKEFFQARLENMINECVDKLKTECDQMLQCAKEEVQQDDERSDDEDDTQPSFSERLQAHNSKKKKRSLSKTSDDMGFEKKKKRSTLRCLCYVTCGSSQEPIKLNALKQKADKNKAKPYVIQKYKDYKKFFKTETQASNVEIYFKRCANRRPSNSSSETKVLSFIDTKKRFFSVKNKRITPCIRCFHAGVTASQGKVKHLTNTRKQIYFGWLYSLKCAIEQASGRGFRKFGLKTFGTKSIKWDKPVAVCCSEIGGVPTCDACLERSRPNSAEKVSGIAHEFPEFQHLLMKSYGANIHAFNVLDILCRNRKSKRKQEFTIGEHLTGIYLEENNQKQLFLNTTQKKTFDDIEVAKNMMKLGNGSSKK